MVVRGDGFVDSSVTGGRSTGCLLDTWRRLACHVNAWAILMSNAEVAPDEALEQEVLNDPLTLAVMRAQTGLRSEVAALVEALNDAEFLVPLAADIPDTPEGERVETDEPLTIQPHMVLDPEGGAFCVFFTHVVFVEPIANQLQWGTDGGELKLCTLMAKHALQMALSVIDEVEVRGLVLNPGTDCELTLLRDEVASLAQGQALPLVGYVEDITSTDEGATLLAEPADPPPPEFLQALEAASSALEGVLDYKVQRTFNPERDREPHLTIQVRLANDEVDRELIAETLADAVEGTVPPPGYLDIVFSPVEED